MRSFFIGLCAIFAVIGFSRTFLEYGFAGLAAYAKFLLGPALVTSMVLVALPRRYGGARPRSVRPPDPALKRIGSVVAFVTAAAIILSGMFGVGWLVTK